MFDLPFGGGSKQKLAMFNLEERCEKNVFELDGIGVENKAKFHLGGGLPQKHRLPSRRKSINL